MRDNSALRWSCLLHLGYNLWHDRPNPVAREGRFAPYKLKSDELLCDRSVWDAVVDRMAAVGMNHLVVDVAEGLRYESHPELAVRGSWSAEDLNTEVRRLRERGIEAVPKLNFSATHDVWLGEYARMVSSPTYYRVCADLIGEVSEVFERPALFHIGMDEETAGHQRQFNHAVIRQHELWYHDVRFLAEQVEAAGSRPWMWADRIWYHPEEFVAEVPRSIVQSNWYYFDQFDFAEDEPALVGPKRLSWTRVQAYEALEEAGYEQFPCGSSFASSVNLRRTVDRCADVIDEARLWGYLTAPWFATVADKESDLLDAVDQMGAEVVRWRSR